jgi:hypothetical protein
LRVKGLFEQSSASVLASLKEVFDVNGPVAIVSSSY